MAQNLLITIRFLDGRFHGRADQGEPEWPPSPLRLFQALVAASAAKWKDNRLTSARSALVWLEKQEPPLIIAPRGTIGAKYRLYVPDNIGDKKLKKSEKDVLHRRLEESAAAVHYAWTINSTDDLSEHLQILLGACHSITHVGWGTDQVVADAATVSDEVLQKLKEHRWYPSIQGEGVTLRVPIEGSLENLVSKHSAFLNRTSDNTFRPVPPLSVFGIQAYQNDSEPSPPPIAAFSLLNPDFSGYQPFDTARKSTMVAAMMRHAASAPRIGKALGWPAEKIVRLVLGHAEDIGSPHQPVDGPRLAFLPLPSIETRGPGQEVLGSIRRVLVSGMRGCNSEEVQSISRLLVNCGLMQERTFDPVAMLSRIPSSDKMVERYSKPSSCWASVTPVILPGYDDPKHYRRRLFQKASESLPLDPTVQKNLLERLSNRIEMLLRKAIHQAGYSDEMAKNAELAWSNSGFWRGAEMADKYVVSEKQRRFPRLHVRIKWRDSEGNSICVPGPICIGGGRFGGVGLFASI